MAVTIPTKNQTMDDIARLPGSSSRKIFIQRDYSEGTGVKFQMKFPAELQNKIDRSEFEETVSQLNRMYAEADKLSRATIIEGCFACLSAYLIYLCMETHYEKCLKRVRQYIHNQNENVYAPRGLLLTDPIERGLRVIEITILDDNGIGTQANAANNSTRT